MYEISWKQKRTLDVFGYQCKIPDMPSRKQMVNYGKKPENQYFARTGLKFEELTTLDPKEQDKRILEEWHKRHNGEWQLIKGQPVYINGMNWHFLNYWHILDDNVGLPDFYYRNTLVYYLLDHLLRWEDNCYGVIVGKGRRLNLTEISQHIQYEIASRKRGFRTLNLNKEEDQVLQDLERVVHAHNMMATWFKPIAYNDRPTKGGLYFKMPSKRKSQKELEDEYSDDYEEEDSKVLALQSYLTYGSTTENKGDGMAYNLIRVSEAAKIDPSRLHVYKHWLALKPTMQKNGVRKGFAIYESTVEEMAGGQTLEIYKKVWDLSDPKDKIENGSTRSGLFRVFIPYIPYGAVDEYGMPDEDKARKDVEMAKMAAGENSNDLLDVKRKFPEREEDMWATANNQSPFNLSSIVTQMEFVNARIYQNGERMKMPRRGDLVWSGAAYQSPVIFIENPNGAFNFTQEPIEPNKFLVGGNGLKVPANKHIYSMGVDPYNTIVYEGRRSDGACLVYRKYDMSVDMEGLPVHEKQTEQPVMIYAHRHENPEFFYEDMAKIAYWYGCEMLYESNRSGMELHFMRNGMINYIMLQPREATAGFKQKPNFGMASSEKTISQYIEYIKKDLSDNIQSIRFIELLSQLSTFTNDRQGRLKHDLVIAYGFALIAAEKRYSAPKTREDEKLSDWVMKY